MQPTFGAAGGLGNVAARPHGEQRPKRASRRTPHRVPCRVTLYDPSSGEPTALVGQTTNLSRKGLALQLGCDVAPGTWLEALVPQLDGTPMFFCGTVAHSRRVLVGTYEIGIQFVSESSPAAL